MHDHVPRSPADPLGYYAALGVGPLADASEIKAAYRAQAKIQHPDINPSEEAGLEFQRIVEAYRVLKDSSRRVAYDATARRISPLDLFTPSDTPGAPLRCSRCGKVTAQPRVITFYRVKSFLLHARRLPIHGIFCRSCADRTVIRASTMTWLQGWWGVTGPFHTLAVLWRNMKGGDRPRGDNLWALLHQGHAFLARDEPDIARSLAEHAREFVVTEAERLEVARLAARAGPYDRILKNRWRSNWPVAVLQSLPLLALLLAVGVILAVPMFRARTEAVSADIILHPAQAGETRHVAVDLLKVRLGPSSAQPVVALLDQFATVQVMDSDADGEWARILTPAGVTGWVPSRFLFGGTGSAPRTRWCGDHRGEPPANGEVLMRRSGGEHIVRVVNESRQDMVVRLKTPNGQTLVSFFLQAASDAIVTGIPDGTFRVVFATGDDYSRACGVFLSDMRTFIVPTVQSFHADARGRERLLRIPVAGDQPGQSRPLSPEAFLEN